MLPRYVTPSPLLLIFTRPHTSPNHTFFPGRGETLTILSRSHPFICRLRCNLLNKLDINWTTAQLSIMGGYQYVNGTRVHIYLSNAADLPRLFNYSNSLLPYSLLLCVLSTITFLNVNYSNTEERAPSTAQTQYCKLIPSYCLQICRHKVLMFISLAITVPLSRRVPLDTPHSFVQCWVWYK